MSRSRYSSAQCSGPLSRRGFLEVGGMSLLGLGLGVALQRSLADQGIGTLGVPWVLLGIVLVLAAVVGVFAALWPARRAARLDVLTAITTE